MKTLRTILGIISLICLFITFGVVGSIDAGAPMYTLIFCVPLLLIFVFNCWLLGVID